MMTTITVRHKRNNYVFRQITEFRWVCDLDAGRTLQVHSAPSCENKARPWRVLLQVGDRFDDMGATSRFTCVRNAGKAAMEYFHI